MRIEARPAAPAAAAILAEIDALGRAFVTGDVRPKPYARRRQDLLAALGRSKIAPALEPGESVAAEHHWVEGHARLPVSPFREMAQVACSLYATDRRLFRWRFQDQGRPDAALRDDCEERLEYQWYEDLADIRARACPRWGEAATGAVIVAVAWLASGHLSVTGPFLGAVGLFGLVHAVTMPTRTVVLEARQPDEEPWSVWAARTKSGRALLAHVAARVAPHPSASG
jgi:hypothetical protein